MDLDHAINFTLGHQGVNCTEVSLVHFKGTIPGVLVIVTCILVGCICLKTYQWLAKRKEGPGYKSASSYRYLRAEQEPEQGYEMEDQTCDQPRPTAPMSNIYAAPPRKEQTAVPVGETDNEQA